MTRFSKQIAFQVLAAGLLASSALAGSKESPHDLLVRSFQQSDLWAQGPVKLAAKVRMPGTNGQDLNLDYVVSWVSPEKWRAEWSGSDLQVVTVLNNGKLSHFSNQPTPLVRALQFEAALAALDGGSPAGPYSLPPLDYQKAKPDATKKKINGTEAKCLTFGQPAESFCIDPGTGHLLAEEGAPGTSLGTFEYRDYASAGNNAYPQSVKVSLGTALMEDGTVTVTRGEKFDESLFAAPEKSTSVDFRSCADVDKNYTAPHVSKVVAAKMPDAARKAKKYGVVFVLTTVGKDGSVQKAQVVGGVPELSSAATDAVQKYKFTPYLRCGEAVEFQQVLVVPFAPPEEQKTQLP